VHNGTSSRAQLAPHDSSFRICAGDSAGRREFILPWQAHGQSAFHSSRCLLRGTTVASNPSSGGFEHEYLLAADRRIPAWALARPGAHAHKGRAVLILRDPVGEAPRSESRPLPGQAARADSVPVRCHRGLAAGRLVQSEVHENAIIQKDIKPPEHPRSTTPAPVRGSHLIRIRVAGFPQEYPGSAKRPPRSIAGTLAYICTSIPPG